MLFIKGLSVKVYNGGALCDVYRTDLSAKQHILQTVE